MNAYDDEPPRGGVPQRYDHRGGPPAPIYPAPRGYLPEEEEGFDIHRYIGVLLERKWLIVAVAATVVVLAAIQVFTTTPLYRATATVQIDPQGQNVLPYEEIQMSGAGYLYQDYMETEAEKMRSRAVRHRVARRLAEEGHPGLDAEIRAGALTRLAQAVRGAAKALLLPQPDEPAAGATGSQVAAAGGAGAAERVPSLPGYVEVRPLRSTRLVEVSFISPSRELAADAADTYVEEFIKLHLESKLDATVQASEFLSSQIEELQAQVERSEEALLRYAAENEVTNVDERESIGQKRLADLSDELTEVESELINLRSRWESLRGIAPAELPDSLKNDTVRQVEQRLADRELELSAASSRYGPEWPAVKKLRVEIEGLRQQLAAEHDRLVAAARKEYEVAAARRARLAQALEEQRAVVNELNEGSIQYKILQRQVDSTQQLYDGLLKRVKEAGVAAGLESTNIQLADPAEVPTVAESPKKTRTLVQALLLGLVLGIGAAFGLESIDTSVRDPEEISRRLGLPTLAVVPAITLDGRRGAASLRDRLGTSRGGPRVPQIAFPSNKGTTADQRRDPRAAEAYRALRTSLLLSTPGEPPQVVVVTSALAREGKSTTVANLAVALAQTGARTLALDLDLRKPALARAFGVSRSRGMSDYLAGNADLSDLIQQTDYTNLSVVGAGPEAPNPAELLGSERLATGLRLAREYFTHVVIDTPPTLEVADALILSPRVDGTILVVRGGKTPRKAIEKATDEAAKVGARILGVVVNDADRALGGYGYGYRYGYGYTYGYGAYGSERRRLEEDTGELERVS